MENERRLKRLVAELRWLLAVEDTNRTYRKLAKRDRANRRGPAYKLVARLQAISVRMDGAKNHARPHIHLDLGKRWHAASIALDDGTVLAGDLKGQKLAEVTDWVCRHQTALLRIWNEMQAGHPVEALILELQAQEPHRSPPKEIVRKMNKRAAVAKKTAVKWKAKAEMA